MSTAAAFPAASAQVVEVVRGVRTFGPDVLAHPTPCTDFDLGRLVNHFIGTSSAMARLGRRVPLDADDPYGSSQDHTAGDWQQALVAGVEAAATAWERPEAWDGSVDMGGSAMPAPMIGDMALAEILLHGWDLARATGQSLTVSDEVARELRRGIEETAELGRRMGAYGDRVALPEHASDFECALAAAGRDPRWSA